jgi:predicted DNA-binding ribbon-helix-helix protein
MRSRYSALRLLDHFTWQALTDNAAAERLMIHQLADAIDKRRLRELSLTVALRCCAVSYFRAAGLAET